jgi:hypothetical protein
MISLSDEQLALQEAWRAHLSELAAESGVPMDDLVAAELLETLAYFCRSQNKAQVVCSDYISLLLARVLYSLGRAEDADSVLSHTHLSFLDTWHALIESDEVIASLWPFVQARIIRPAQWFSFDDAPAWVLDLRMMALRDSEAHEMIEQRVIRLLLEKIAMLWEAQRGRGYLCLRGVKEFSLSQSASFSVDLVEYIRRVLLKIAENHGWDAVPQIKLLELH